VRHLLRHDLVDECRLMVFPVLLAGGRRLLADEAQARALGLVEARPVGECVILTWRPAPWPERGTD
jgi:dihydrofolate reductase